MANAPFMGAGPLASEVRCLEMEGQVFWNAKLQVVRAEISDRGPGPFWLEAAARLKPRGQTDSGGEVTTPACSLGLPGGLVDGLGKLSCRPPSAG